jgi:heptaprenyl diphosphate synthase
VEEKVRKKAGFAALSGLLAALALTFSMLEGMLPPLPGMPPGAKLGLSNVVMMYAAGSLGLPWAMALAVIKGGFALLTRGVTAGAMSLSGGLLSTACAWAVLKKTRASFALTGICGAMAHNAGQVLVAFWMMGPAVLGYGPVLILASLATGALTGAVLRVSLPQMERVSDFLVGKRP